MNSLQSILNNKEFHEPDEIQHIKKYVYATFNSKVEVVVHDKTITIMVPNAALANTLRLRIPEIQKLCETKKRLIFLIV